MASSVKYWIIYIDHTTTELIKLSSPSRFPPTSYADLRLRPHTIGTRVDSIDPINYEKYSLIRADLIPHIAIIGSRIVIIIPSKSSDTIYPSHLITGSNWLVTTKIQS